MPRREPPPTEEGLFALHDFRTFDWSKWRRTDREDRDRVLTEAIDYLERQGADGDGNGGFGLFSVLGHKADLLMFHLRPTLEAVEVAARRFEQTEFSSYTERPASYVSVTEVSGYTSQAFFEGEDVEDPGLDRYMRTRLYPRIPDAEFLCFYPMSKRREPEFNWYDLSFAERANYMEAHGEIGRRYAGKVTQIITGSIGFDDWEWGVTLFADDPTAVKHLLYEMRFDPSTSKFAEFGPFRVGHRFKPRDLGRFVAGESIRGEADDGRSSNRSRESPTVSGLDFDLESLDLAVEPEDLHGAHGVVLRSSGSHSQLEHEVDDLRGNFDNYDSHVLTEVHPDPNDEDASVIVSLWKTERAVAIASGYLEGLDGVTDVVDGRVGSDDPANARAAASDRTISEELAELGIYAGRPHGEDVYAMVLYSTADRDTLRSAIDELREGFDRYDTHVRTAVYDGSMTNRRAIVSLWETQNAAETAGEYLSDLPDVVARAGEESGFGTMGMFYTVKPEHRADFVDRFEDVGGLIAELEGHIETDLMVNVEDDNDMFIASQWRNKEDALEFFRDEAFRETVQWGRDILADRPRHVFLT